MTEDVKREELNITGELVKEWLDTHDKDEVFEQMQQLVSNVKTLQDRIQDIIMEDQMLTAALDISFVGSLTVMGEVATVQMLGDRSSTLLTLNALKDAYMEQHMSDEERSTLKSMQDALFKKE